MLERLMQCIARYVLAAMCACTGVSATFAQANLQIIVASSTVTAPSMGNTFEVSIFNAGSTASVPIAGFSFGLSVPGGSGVTFTNATISTLTNPYIFAGFTSTPPFSNTAFPNQSFIASDIYDNTGGIVVGPGATFGLGLITFDVASNFSNPTTVTLAGFPSTSLSDDQAGNVTFTGLNGTISLSAVPEPATWAMMGLGASAMLGWCYRRRRAMMKQLEAKVK
jgi:hypothetical protein